MSTIEERLERIEVKLDLIIACREESKKERDDSLSHLQGVMNGAMENLGMPIRMDIKGGPTDDIPPPELEVRLDAPWIDEAIKEGESASGESNPPCDTVCAPGEGAETT